MQLARLKDFYLAGAISAADVSYDHMLKGWVLTFHFRPGTGPDAAVLETQREAIRTFKTADAALSTLASMGILSAWVSIPASKA